MILSSISVPPVAAAARVIQIASLRAGKKHRGYLVSLLI